MGPFQLLLLMIIPITTAKSNFTKTGYFPVPGCPKNTQEWQASSRRLNCNDTHKYHCAPYYDHSQLYEFCYERTLLKVNKGFCIGIAESGILNRLTCEMFSHGCPPEDYDSSQLYKYPSCLSIHNDCFTEDCVCKCQSAGKPIVIKTNKSDTETSGQTVESASCENQTEYFSAFVVCLVFLILSTVVNFLLLIWILKRNQSNQGKQEDLGNAHADEEQLQRGDNTNAPADEEQRQRGDNTNALADEEQHLLSEDLGNAHADEEQLQRGDNSNAPADEEQRQRDHHEADVKRLSFDRKQETSGVLDDIYKMTLVDYTIEDEQLFKLLKRQCFHAVPTEFEYLVNTRVLPENKNYIFEQRDENGCILLHYAAQGGDTVILNVILENAPTKTDILEYKCIRGQYALHYAIRYKQRNMIYHLIRQHSKILKTKSIQSEKPKREFSPVHWAAWFGDTRLLDSLFKYGFAVSTQTKNGLNILDIACMKTVMGESKVEFAFCKHLLDSNLFGIDPRKSDNSGWNITHYASKSNFKLLQCLADKKYNTPKDVDENELLNLIQKTTNSKKTCLHIACEFAKPKNVRLIAEHKRFEKFVHCTDKLGWNAMHFAAKGGDLDVLKYLLKINGMKIGCKTDDGKTLLHIACIHKRAKICKFVIEQFTNPEVANHEDLLNAKTTNNGLTAAHYLAVEKKEDGSEREIFEMLFDSNMDLLALSQRGLTVLEFAVDHLNGELIKCIVSAKYRGQLNISAEILSNCIKSTQDKRIQKILKAASDEIIESN